MHALLCWSLCSEGKQCNFVWFLVVRQSRGHQFAKPFGISLETWWSAIFCYLIRLWSWNRRTDFLQVVQDILECSQNNRQRCKYHVAPANFFFAQGIWITIFGLQVIGAHLPAFFPFLSHLSSNTRGCSWSEHEDTFPATTYSLRSIAWNTNSYFGKSLCVGRYHSLFLAFSCR